MRHLLLLSLFLGFAACGDSNNKTVDAAPPVDMMAAALSCDTYCSTITAACTGANAQFGGISADDAKAHCLGTCGKFPTSTAQTGDTLGCHMYHATNAMTMDPTVHCIHAGPAGNQIGMPGVCGDTCTNFCTLVQGVCGVKGTDANGQYTDMTDCMNACANFATTATYTVNTTTFPSMNPTGNTLACRLYHATNAAVSASAAGTHCPHTAVVSAVCK
jgi:hypothetical protein